MKTETIHEGINKNGNKFRVVAFYYQGKFFYTRTYIFDGEGLRIKIHHGLRGRYS